MLRQVVNPAMPAPSPSEHVPRHVRHAFWNVDDDTLATVTGLGRGLTHGQRALANSLAAKGS